MWYIVRLDSSRVATLVKVSSATLVSSSDPTRVKSNYIQVETTILRQIKRCQLRSAALVSSESQVELYTSKNYDFTANRMLARN